MIWPFDRRQSLTGNLLKQLIIVFCLFWLLSAAAAIWQMADEFNETLDEAMVQTAHLLLILAEDEIDDEDENDSEVQEFAQELTFDGVENSLAFQLKRADGRILSNSVNVAARELEIPLVTGFDQAGGFRTYTVSSQNGRFWLHVMDRLDHRHQALIETGAFLLLPLLAFPLIVILPIARIVRRGLKPVEELASEIGARDGRHLSAIQIDDLPQELRPLGISVNRMLARLSKAIEGERHFATTSAHELRTPVATALAQVQRLAAVSNDKDTVQRALEVQSSLMRLSSLVERLLELARAEAGMALGREKNDVMAAMRLILADHKDLQSRLIVEGLEQSTLIWPLDMDAAAIVLSNLLDNAKRHGDPDLPIELRFSNQTLSIINGGPIIEAKRLARLRDRFERDFTRSDGFGLGLSIVSTIIAQAGGELTLSSPATGRQSGFGVLITFDS